MPLAHGSTINERRDDFHSNCRGIICTDNDDYANLDKLDVHIILRQFLIIATASYSPASSIPELEKQADGLQEAIRECQETISQYKVMQTMAFEDYAEGIAIAQISPII